MLRERRKQSQRLETPRHVRGPIGFEQSRLVHPIHAVAIGYEDAVELPPLGDLGNLDVSVEMIDDFVEAVRTSPAAKMKPERVRHRQQIHHSSFPMVMRLRQT